MNAVRARFLACFVMVSAPTVVCAVMLACQGLSLADYGPGTNDEVGYYLQINAFVHKGLDGGYFTMNEIPAPASFSHFGVHGPLFPILYGLVGKAIGWHLYSGPLFNCGFLTLALVVFCLVHRPTVFQALLGAAFLATYWPLYLSLISNAQDPVHFAAAVLFATYFAALLRNLPACRTRIFHAGFWLLLIYASLMRISWAMMLFPYLLLHKPLSSKSDLYARMARGVVVVIVLLYVFRFLCAPYPNDDSAFLMNKIIGLEVFSLRYFLNHAWYNVKCFVSGQVTYGSCLPGLLVFYEAVAFGTVMALWMLASLWGPAARRGFRPSSAEPLFHSYNIWVLTLAMILLYYIDRDGAWRMFCGHFLLAALMVIVSATPRLYWLPIAAVAVNVACALPCLATIEQFNVSRFGHAHKVREFGDAVAGLIVYEDGVDPWRNTILTDRYPPALAGLPAGIGVSVYLRPREFPPRPKSKYLIVDADQLALLPADSKLVRTLILAGRLSSPSRRSTAVLAINALAPGASTRATR